MMYSEQNFRGGEAKRENHIDTPSLFIHAPVDAVFLSSGIPSIYSRKSRTRLIRDVELPVNVKSLHYSRIMSRQRFHCDSSISGEEPAREPDSKGQSRFQSRRVLARGIAYPGPGSTAVPSSPASVMGITGLHHPMERTATREVLLLLLLGIEIPGRAS